MSAPKRAGRPPGPEGTQRRYTVMLSPVQVRRALTLGATISQGINNALRELVPDAPLESVTSVQPTLGLKVTGVSNIR